MLICRTCGSVLHDPGGDLRHCWCSVRGSSLLWRPSRAAEFGSPEAEDRSHAAAIGLVAGATVGGVLGGPVGAVVGGLLGVFFGANRSNPRKRFLPPT